MDRYQELFENNKMTLIMSMPFNDPLLCDAAFCAGAHAVKVHINVNHRASGNGFGRLSQYRSVFEQMLRVRKGPMGLMLGGSLENASLDVSDAIDTDFSFFSVYMHHAPLELLHAPQALMAACDYSYSLDEISCMSSLGAAVIEASIIPGEEYGTGLQLRDLIHYKKIVDAGKLPVIVPTQRKIRPDQVKSLYEIGVRGIMIGSIVTGKESESIVRTITEFREEIEKC